MAPEKIQPQGTELIFAEVDSRKGRLLVEITEDVVSTHVPELRKGLRSIIETAGTGDWAALYLDMRSARMVDSMGMNWLFAESVRLKQENKEMVIRISSPAIHRVMQFAGLEKVVTLKFRRRKQTR